MIKISFYMYGSKALCYVQSSNLDDNLPLQKWRIKCRDKFSNHFYILLLQVELSLFWRSLFALHHHKK